MMAGRTSQPPAEPATVNRTWRIRDADGEDDAWYLQRLWHYWFGAEYESRAELQYDLFPIAGWSAEDEDKTPVDAYAAIAEHAPADQSGTVRIGAGLALLYGPERTIEQLPSGRFDSDALVDDRNVWLMLNAVDDCWRGQGIGWQLLQRRLEWARSTNAGMAFACGWERDGKPTSRPLLDAAGFVPVQTIEGMYAESGRMSCPDCGIWPSDDRPCTCDATLWALDLPTGESK